MRHRKPKKQKAGCWKATTIMLGGEVWGTFDSQKQACEAVAKEFGVNPDTFRTKRGNSKLGLTLIS